MVYFLGITTVVKNLKNKYRRNVTSTTLKKAIIESLRKTNKVYGVAILTSVEKILLGTGDTTAIVLDAPPFNQEAEYFKDMAKITVTWTENDTGHCANMITSLSYDDENKMLFMSFNPTILQGLKEIIKEKMHWFSFKKALDEVIRGLTGVQLLAMLKYLNNYNGDNPTALIDIGVFEEQDYKEIKQLSEISISYIENNIKKKERLVISINYNDNTRRIKITINPTISEYLTVINIY